MGPLTTAVLSLLRHSENCPQCAPIILRKVFTEEFLGWSADPASQMFSDLGKCQLAQGETHMERVDYSEDIVNISVGSDVDDPTDDISLDDISSDSDLLDQLERNNPEFIVTFEDVTLAQNQSPMIRRLIDESIIPVPDELEYVSSVDEEIYIPEYDMTYDDVTLLDADDDIMYEDITMLDDSAEQAKFEQLYCTIDNSKPRKVSVSSSSSPDIEFDYEPGEHDVIGLQFIVRTEVLTTVNSALWCTLCKEQIKLRQADGVIKHATSLHHCRNVLEQVYDEVLPDTMDPENLAFFLSTVRLYQEREKEAEEGLAEILRGHIKQGSPCVELVDQLNQGISSVPDHEEIRFDMKKGFVKVVGIVDVVMAKKGDTTIIRSDKANVYIILKDASKQLTAQTGSEVWVAGNVSRRLSALVMIIKAWGVVPGDKTLLVTANFSGRQRHRSVEDKKALSNEREKMLSSYRERRVSENADDIERELSQRTKSEHSGEGLEEVKETSSPASPGKENRESGKRRVVSGETRSKQAGQADHAYPLTRTSDLHKRRGQQVSVQGQVTGYRVIRSSQRPLILADFTDQWGSCQLTLRGEKVCGDVARLSGCNTVFIKGSCYDVRNGKKRRLELVLEHWEPAVGADTSLKTQGTGHGVKTGGKETQTAHNLRTRDDGNIRSSDARHSPSRTKAAAHTKAPVHTKTAVQGYKDPFIHQPTYPRENCPYRPHYKEMRQDKKSSAMPDLVPLPARQDKALAVIEEEYAPVVFIEKLHHYIGRRVLTWGTLKEFRSDGRGKRAFITNTHDGASYVEVQFPRSMVVLHDDKSMDVVVEGILKKHGTETVLEATYTEPLGNKGRHLGFQGNSTMNVKCASNMAIVKLSDLALHLRKHVVIRAEIKDIVARTSKAIFTEGSSGGMVSGQFREEGVVCNFNIACCLQRYGAFYPTDQVIAVVKVSNNINQGDTMPTVSVEYMTLSSDPIDTATEVIANALKHMVLNGGLRK